MRITVATPKAYRYACLYYHYAKSVPTVTAAFNVYNDAGEWCGVIIYSPGATPHIADPFDKYQGQVLELVRVALNGKQGHGKTSEALAMTLKAIKIMFPWVDLIVSYADIDQGHAGILYQSTNWLYLGIANPHSRGAFIIHGKKMHPKSVYSKGWKQSLLWLKENIDPAAEEFITEGKHKYVYPLNKKMRKQIKPLIKEYPK